MKKFRSNPVVLTLLGLAGLTVLLSQPWVNAGAFTAAASAIAAIGALLAAQQSSAAAKESVRALSYATKPSVWVETLRRGGVDINLRNRSVYRATSIAVTYQSRSGTVLRRTLPFVDGEGGNLPYPRPQLISLERGFPTGDGVDQVIVEYGAEHGETRWRLTLDYDDDMQMYLVVDEQEV